MAVIWRSKAFWLAILDTVAGLLTLLGAAFWPDKAELIGNIWKYIQPILVLIIGLLATEEIVIPMLMARLR